MQKTEQNVNILSNNIFQTLKAITTTLFKTKTVPLNKNNDNIENNKIYTTGNEPSKNKKQSNKLAMETYGNKQKIKHEMRQQ